MTQKYFVYSVASIVSGTIDPRCQSTVRRASEKTLSGSSDMAEIERTSIAKREKSGYAVRCTESVHQASRFSQEINTSAIY